MICSIPGCEKQVTCQGMCNAHYLKAWRRGETESRKRKHNMSLGDLVSMLEREGEIDAAGCLISPRYKDSGGYPRCEHEGNWRPIHRLIVEHYLGPKPEPKAEVCHSCHNRACINIEHLRYGTKSENQIDRRNIGRCTNQKLDASKVREIRRLHAETDMGAVAIGERFGIGRRHVNRIISREQWADVQ